MRQALAGMFWTKQYYYFDVDRWLGEHGVDPFDRAGSDGPEPTTGSTWSTPT